MLSLSCFFPIKSQKEEFNPQISFNSDYDFHECFDKDGCLVILDGEVYNFQEIHSNYKTVTEAIYYSLKDNKLKEFVKLLDGSFSLLILDKNNSKVILAADRFGSRFLYYRKSESGLYIADKVHAIVDANEKDVNALAVNQFLDLGYILEDATLFNSIRLLEPAMIVEFKLEESKLTSFHERYWSWSTITKADISFEDAVEKLGVLFDQAVRRRFDPMKRIGASLSGGLDSRANIASINKQFPDYKGVAFTFGIPGCDDIEIASKVAKLADWKHVTFHFTGENWFNARKERIYHTDGLQDMKHMHGSEFLSSVKEYVDINFNGYAGDVIAGGGFLGRLPLNTRAKKESLETFFKPYTDSINSDIEFYDIASCEPVVLMNRVRRFTTMGVINSMSHIQPRMPFIDKDLLEFIYSLPEEYRYRNLIYSKMLLNNYPKFFNDIPWQKTGKRVGLSPKADFLYKVINKLKKYYTRLIVTKNRKEYTDYASWIRDSQVRQELYQLLDSKNSYVSKYIKEDYKDIYLEPHINNKLLDHSDKILRYATLEIYFRKVFS